MEGVYFVLYVNFGSNAGTEYIYFVVCRYDILWVSCFCCLVPISIFPNRSVLQFLPNNFLLLFMVIVTLTNLFSAIISRNYTFVPYKKLTFVY